MSKATPETEKRRAARLLSLVAIVAVLAAMKFSYLPGTGPFGTDGAFYVNVARNVQEGVGVRTNVSLYHYGLTELPTRSAIIYPLWPLLLGYTARLFGLFEVVNFLPSLLYVLDLLLLYVLVNRLAARIRRRDAAEPAGGDAGAPERWRLAGPPPLVAHLLVALFGLNVQLVGTTTFPYTEGLGFFLAFGALILLDRAVTDRPVMYGVLAAVASGLALLTRTQLIVVGLAIALTVVGVAIADRRFVRVAVAFLGTYAVIGGYWFFFVRGVTGSPSVALPPFVMWVQPVGISGFLRDRWEGLVVSLSPFSPYSYFALFGAAFLLPLIAIVLAAVRWRQFRLRAESALAIACVLIALGTFASLNLYHSIPGFVLPWVFGYRHGLPMILGIAVAAVFLMRGGKAMRLIAIACIALSIVFGAISVLDLVTAPRTHSPTAEEAQLFAWLEQQQPTPVVITPRAQHVSAYTHASLHWTECRTRPETTRLMLARLPIDYVIVYPIERQCEFVRGLGDVLVERTGFGAGANRITVLARRTARVPASSQSARTPPG